MQNKELRHRMPPILAALKELSLTDQTPVTNLRMRACPYHSWNTVQEEPTGPAWSDFADGNAIGGEESHYAFRGTITAPECAAGRHLVCLVETGADNIWNNNNPQFLAYLDGALLCGLDTNHTEFDLAAAAQAGQTWQLGLYAYTNTPAHDVFLRVSTAIRDDEVTGLYYDLRVPFEVLSLLDENDTNAIGIGRYLAQAVNMLDLRDPDSDTFRDSVTAARRYLRDEFYLGYCHDTGVTVSSVGHTHIDVAWLWTLAQTREKAIRSFATVNYLMDRYPEYRFMASQPQLYDYVRRDCPALYDRIRERVANGRWETEGGMWLESDCNMTSGESLIRQFLHGREFTRREFGQEGHILWLPDAFGFSAALPQIMRQCGMTWFMTTKLAWNDTNCMPHDLTRWRGIDGTEVLAYFISTKDYDMHPDCNTNPSFNTTYNGTMTPRQVMGCWQRFQDKDLTSNVLQCYGTGDGGGGVTAEMLEIQRRLSAGIPGAPTTVMSHVAPYYDQLEKDLAAQGEELPLWSGEFYFEYHRGVFTSQARNKHANRMAEFANMIAESMASLAAACVDGYTYPADALHHSWELTLLNQFHDILPGSAIGPVYEVSQAQYRDLLTSDQEILQQAMQAHAALVHNTTDGILVWNPLGFARDAVVTVPCETPHGISDGTRVLPSHYTEGMLQFTAADLPAKGWRFYPYAEPASEDAECAEITHGAQDGWPLTITTPLYQMVLAADGCITSLYDRAAEREVLPAGARANELQLYEDRPDEYDAWNIEQYYRRHRYPMEAPISIRVLENTAVRCVLRVLRRISRSDMVQDIILYPDNRRIDFATRVDWHEQHVLLKAAFPVDVCTDHAQYDIQFGSLSRPNHSNTSWDSARFEVCAHKWADLSEPGYGVALLNDGRYGYDVHDNVLRLSLLRAATYPDPQADQGAHEFTYALLPHTGDWRTGGVIAAGYDLNVPAPALPVAANPAGTLPASYEAFHLDAENVILETVKRAEDGDGYILRLYEAWGARTDATLTLPDGYTAAPCTPLEDPIAAEEDRGDTCSVSGNVCRLRFHPFALRSLRMRRL